ncbi:MAG: hypothetical protein ACRDAM_20815 [Casimicrobium sp.]
MAKKNKAQPASTTEVITLEAFLETVAALPEKEQIAQLTARVQADNAELEALRAEKTVLEAELEEATGDEIVMINGVAYVETVDSDGVKTQTPR